MNQRSLGNHLMADNNWLSERKMDRTFDEQRRMDIKPAQRLKEKLEEE